MQLLPYAGHVVFRTDIFPIDARHHRDLRLDQVSQAYFYPSDRLHRFHRELF